MSSPYIELGGRKLDLWKVTELKEELKRRKLTTKGLKEDLIKRLDEAVRSEREESMDKSDNDATEPELPPEPANTVSHVSESAQSSVDKDIVTVEKVDATNEISDSKGPLGEDKVIESDLVKETNAAELEGEHVAQFSTVGTAVVVNETDEPVTVLNGSQLEIHGKNEDGQSITLLNKEEYHQGDGKLELSPNTQPPQINQSSIPVAPLSPSNLQDTGTQNEAIQSTDQTENDDSKCPPPASSVQPLKYQVSEADLGFQVTSDSISTESFSIIEKNELKIDIITDNVQLEQDGKHEMVQPSPSSAVPDGGESHPMDVEEPPNRKDIEEPIDKKDFQDPVCNDPVNLDSLNDINSGDVDLPEKLSLDRSSGDDSMEEDISESKQIEEKLETFTDNVKESEIPGAKEEDHVDVVGHDKSVETKLTVAENETASALTSGKRKFQDKEAVGNNEVKKARSWNAEGLKKVEPQSGSKTPKGSSEPSFKPISGANSTVNGEAPKERQVPPPSRPPTNSLRIDRFLRPFTLKAVQELLGKTGTVTSFWMDHIKTHCYVSYASVEEAVESRNAVYNLQWPPNGGRLLVAEFVDPQEVKSRLEAPPASPATPSTNAAPTFAATQHPPAMPPQPSPRQHVPRQPLPPPSLPPPPLSNPPPIRERLQPPREQPPPGRDRLNLPPPPPLPEKVDPPIVTLDDLFRKTKATPRIYYLPLSEEQVAAKLKTLGKNVNQ